MSFSTGRTVTSLPCVSGTLALILFFYIKLLGYLATAYPAAVEAVTETNINYSNYQMINIWRSNYLSYSWTRIYISDICKFVYLTSLKTASFTTRQMIDTKTCGLGYHIEGNSSWWKSCGNRACTQTDVDKIRSNNYFKIIFVREPIARYESLYNFLSRGKWRQTYTNNTINKMRFKYPNATSNELHFLQYTHCLYDDVMNGSIWGQSKHMQGKWHASHHQPLSFYACLHRRKRTSNIACFIPSFVGRMETLPDDIHWIQEHGIIPGNNTDHFNKILALKHTTHRINVEKGTIYKYPDELLLICKIYWNDFFCAYYTDKIPIQCQKMNDNVWHFPTYCVDLNGKRVSWPMPNTY
eukprot:266191_1